MAHTAPTKFSPFPGKAPHFEAELAFVSATSTFEITVECAGEPPGWTRIGLFCIYRLKVDDLFQHGLLLSKPQYVNEVGSHQYRFPAVSIAAGPAQMWLLTRVGTGWVPLPGMNGAEAAALANELEESIRRLHSVQDDSSAA